MDFNGFPFDLRFKVDLNDIFFGLSKALSACGKALLCDVALRLLRGCEAMAVEATVVTFNAAIDAAEKSAEWRLALSLFDEARRSRESTFQAEISSNLIEFKRTVRGFRWILSRFRCMN